jgi:hypothetical protein
LIVIANATNVFIPVIPFILEVFDITDFNKKHATISVKQLNFAFLLKLNKQQLNDLTIQVRRDILRMVHAVNSGHPGGSLGCAEFLVALYQNLSAYL